MPSSRLPDRRLGYTAIYDPIQIILRHAAKDLTPTPGFRTNYLGVKVDVDRFFPNLKIGKGVESAPIPANWHTDLAEFSAALRAVENAGRDFTMIELGCGWGCWMNITGAAARRAGKRARLISVEGDEGHVGFARDSLTENGFAEDQFIVHHGIVGPREGVAFFPRQSHAGVKWGLEPVIGPSPEDARRLRASGAFSELPMLSLRDVAEGRARIDLLHIDIQGGEVDFVRSCMEELNRVVAYVLVGTHSRAIDGELARAFTESGRWTLEIERPTFYSNVDGVLTTLVDGVQGWRNRSFDAK
ncbi:MAG: class I SAM-dependent methyltransferase [Rhodoblastus sp.]|nr:MAG: class I SAM-dependent methyltransferase [Rhodoblastus sp.]